MSQLQNTNQYLDKMRAELSQLQPEVALKTEVSNMSPIFVDIHNNVGSGSIAMPTICGATAAGYAKDDSI